jgi:hypothetical protein
VLETQLASLQSQFAIFTKESTERATRVDGDLMKLAKQGGEHVTALQQVRAGQDQTNGMLAAIAAHIGMIPKENQQAPLETQPYEAAPAGMPNPGTPSAAAAGVEGTGEDEDEEEIKITEPDGAAADAAVASSSLDMSKRRRQA